MKKALSFVSLIALSFFALAQSEVKNVILLIGDGMGLAQSYAAYLANGKSLSMYTMPYTGLSITSCADREVTDSGAGGTAIATGHKANYKAIGLDKNNISHPSLLKIAKQYGKSTAIVCSCDLTHATPAAFVANVKNRDLQEQIALSYLEECCDIALGGGAERFTSKGRKDKLNLIDSLAKRGYAVVYSEDELSKCESEKIFGLFAEGHLPEA